MKINQSVRLGLAGSAALALFVMSTGPSCAQQSARVNLNDSVIPLSSDVRVVGDASPASVVHFQVALNLRNADALTRSNIAGRVLDYATLEQRYLPTVQDYDRVLAFLKSSGLTVDKASSERLVVSVSGSAAQVSSALGVHFSNVEFEGESLVSADSTPAIPAALADVIQSINGLQPQLRVHKLSKIAPLSKSSDPLLPQAFLNAYEAAGLHNGGSGSTTAIIIDTFPNPSDLTQFWQAAGIRQYLSNITYIQAVAGKLPAPSGEESLDTEISSSVAPNSRVRVYASQSLSDTNVDTAFQAAITDMHYGIPITQVSVSLGQCEAGVSKKQAKTDDNLFAVMSSLGASVLVSSGDSGSKECSGSSANVPSFYSTSPNVTAVRGTTLTINTHKSDPYVETGWSGSGGGYSVIFAAPSYQSQFGASSRLVPDISADADPASGALVVVNGQYKQIGGTSLSAPIWAGLMALVNSDRVAWGGPGVGLLNAHLYAAEDTTDFRDVVKGNNGGYGAMRGYDLVTGIGSPLMDRLESVLTQTK